MKIVSLLLVALLVAACSVNDDVEITNDNPDYAKGLTEGLSGIDWDFTQIVTDSSGINVEKTGEFTANQSALNSRNSDKVADSRDLALALAAGLSELNIDFGRPVIYQFTSESEKLMIINQAVEETYGVSLMQCIDDNGHKFSEELDLNIRINPANNTITITPVIILN